VAIDSVIVDAVIVEIEVLGPDGAIVELGGKGGGAAEAELFGVTVVERVDVTDREVVPPLFVTVAVADVVTTTVLNWSQ
jgi:hypothetical protein